MARHEVPGGGWFDIGDVSALTEDHQNQYLDLGDKLREVKRELSRPAAMAANPAVMPDPADEAEVELTRAEQLPIRALVEGWVVEGSSFGMPLPHPLPLVAANVLRRGLSPVFLALNGQVPKESPGSGSPSTPTSPVPAPAALPESVPEQ